MAARVETSGSVTSVVERLESMLADARAGRLTALAYAAVVERGVATGWVWNPEAHCRLEIIAGVSMLNHRLLGETDSRS